MIYISKQLLPLVMALGHLREGYPYFTLNSRIHNYCNYPVPYPAPDRAPAGYPVV